MFKSIKSINFANFCPARFHQTRPGDRLLRRRGFVQNLAPAAHRADQSRPAALVPVYACARAQNCASCGLEVSSAAGPDAKYRQLSRAPDQRAAETGDVERHEVSGASRGVRHTKVPLCGQLVEGDCARHV